MTTQNETTHAGDFILSEANGNRSRDNATLISGQDLQAGAVIGKITSGGKWTAYDPSASDGSQTNLGILLSAIDASGGDTACVVIARDCEVNGDQLIYKDVSPAPVPATVATALLLTGIVVR